MRFAFLLLCGWIFCAPARAQDGLPPAVSSAARRAGASVVAVLRPAPKSAKKETFRQRWHRLRKEKYGAMNQSGDGLFGAGFFLSKKHIVTSAGLTKDLEVLTVMTATGQVLEAEVLVRDRRNDLALLTIDPKLLLAPIAPLNLSKDLPKLGATVYSLGNTFQSMEKDCQVAVSRGSISAKYLLVTAKGRYRGMVLETNASVNPGLYGGPLVNRKGLVVGLISSTYAEGREAGLAVPSVQLYPILEELQAGRTCKPYLGVEVSPKAKDGRGVPVVEVMPKTPAAELALKKGDLILSIAGLRTDDAMALKRALHRFPPLTTLSLRVERAGKILHFTFISKAVAEAGIKGL